MALTDFLKGAYHQANPFDDGRTFSTHYDSIARKRRKKEEERTQQFRNNLRNIQKQRMSGKISRQQARSGANFQDALLRAERESEVDKLQNSLLGQTGRALSGYDVRGRKSGSDFQRNVVRPIFGGLAESNLVRTIGDAGTLLTGGRYGNELSQFGNDPNNVFSGSRDTNLASKTLRVLPGLARDVSMAMATGGASTISKAPQAGRFLNLANKGRRGLQLATRGSGLVGTIHGTQEAADQYRGARDAGKSQLEAYSTAIPAGIAQGAVERFTTGKLVKPFGGNALTRGISRFLSEGSGEGVQQATSNAFSRTYDDQVNIMDGVGEAFLIGGLAGGSMTTIDVYNTLRQQGIPEAQAQQKTQEIAEEAQAEQDAQEVQSMPLDQVASELNYLNKALDTIPENSQVYRFKQQQRLAQELKGKSPAEQRAIRQRFNQRMSRFEDTLLNERPALEARRNTLQTAFRQLLGDAEVAVETAQEIAPELNIRTVEDLQSFIQGDTQAELKNRVISRLGERLSLDRLSRLLTRNLQKGFDWAVDKSLTSENRFLRTPGRAAKGFSRQAGMNDTQLMARAQFEGAMSLASDISGDMLKSARDLGLDESQVQAVWAQKDPELAKELGIKKRPLTEEEQQYSDYITKVADFVHETNNNMGFLTEEQYEKNKGGKYIARIYNIDQDDDLFKAVSEAAGLKLNKDIYKHRKDLDQLQQELKKLAVKDPAFLTAARLRTTLQNKAVYDYSQWLAENGRVSKTPKKGYIEVPTSSAYGPLQGKYMLKEDLESVSGFIYETKAMSLLNDALSMYENNRLRRLRKEILTVFNPAVSLGNIGSNIVFFGNMAGINPITMTNSMRIARKSFKSRDSLYKEALANGVMGSNILENELPKSLDALEQNQPGVTKTLINKIRKAYGNSDDIAKLAAYKVFRERGLSQQEATIRTLRHFQNYAMVGHFYDMSAKIPIFGKAFGRFASELTRIAANSVVDHPLRMVGTVAAWQTFTRAMSVLSGEDEEDRETREDRVGAPKLPFTDVSLEVQTPFGAINASRLMGVYSLNPANDANSLLAEFGRVAPIDSPVTIDSSGVDQKENGISSYSNFDLDLNPAGISGDPLASPVAQGILNRNFMGEPILNPDSYKLSGDISTKQKALNLAKFAGMSYAPYANEANSVWSALPIHENEETGEVGPKPNYYGAQRTLPQALLRTGGLKVEQYGAEQVERQRKLTRYYADRKRLEQAASQLPSTADKAVWEKLHPRKNREGDKPDVSKQERYQGYLEHPDVLDLAATEAVMANERDGKPIHPLFKLDDLQAKAVMTIEGIPSYVQTEDKALLYETDWYNQYKAAESRFYEKQDKYYDKIFGADESPKRFEQETDNPYPAPSDDLQAKLDVYYELPKGTGQRSAYLEQNPDVLEHWDSVRNWKNKERVKVGLPAIKDEFESSGYGYGSGYSSTPTINPDDYYVSRRYRSSPLAQSFNVSQPKVRNVPTRSMPNRKDFDRALKIRRI